MHQFTLNSVVVHLIFPEQPEDNPFRGAVSRRRENIFYFNIPRFSEDIFEKRSTVCIIRKWLSKYRSYHTAIDPF